MKVICRISIIYLKGTYSIENYVFDSKGLAPEYIPGGANKWRGNVIAMTEAKDILGGYKLFVAVTEIMEPQSQKAANNPFAG